MIDTEEVATPARSVLPQPHGDVETIWRVDTGRWDLDESYRDRVRAFVAAHVIGGSPSDARVIRDQAGHLVFRTESWLNPQGELRLDDRGRPVRKVIMVNLRETVLP